MPILTEAETIVLLYKFSKQKKQQQPTKSWPSWTMSWTILNFLSLHDDLTDFIHLKEE